MNIINRPSRFSRKQLLCTCILLLSFIGITLFLFVYHRDEKLFSRITSQLFVQEMTESTLNMHYTIAHPEDFGIYKYNAVLPVYSSEDLAIRQTTIENLLNSLQKLDINNLNEQDAYTYNLLVRSLNNSLGLNSYPYYEEPLSPSSGMQSQLPILLAEYTFRTKRDIEDYLKLLDQTDEYFASLLIFEQEKSAAGLFMASSSLNKVREQCDTIVTLEELEEETHFLQSTFSERLEPLIASGAISATEAEDYIAQNNRLLKTVLCPAYEALSDGLFLLEDTSIPLTGLADKPQGKEYYEYLLKAETGSYRTASDIKALLTAKLKQEYNAMRTILRENPDIMEHYALKQYTNLPFNNASVMLADLQNRMSSQFPELTKAGGAQPAVSVKSVSPNLEEYCAPAFYLTAPLDDTDTNVIYINQKNAPDDLELYTTLAHEGYPGHLYQTVYNNRSFMAAGENKARQLLWYGGYLEGWALYVEFLSFDYASLLMQEQNLTPDAACIQLEKHNRSLQLCLYSILDIMIHYENASYSQVANVLEGFGITTQDSCSAIYTYIVENPCNYLKYYLGYLEILALQETAMEIWGENYNDYAFHSFYLDCGPSDFTSLTERLMTSSQ